MFEFEVTDINAINEAHRDFYEQKDGKFVLKVNGVVPKAKLDEFRQENITLKQKLEELDGMDLVADAKSGKKVKETIEELAQKRVQTMKSTFETEKAELSTKLTKKQQKLENLLISDTVKAAAISAGVQETALEDIIARVKSKFRVDEEDNVVPVDDIGDNEGKPYTIRTYITDLKTKAPHLFKQSQGTGVFGKTRGSSPSTPERSRQERLAGFLTQKR